MGKEKVRLAIVGAGGIARLHMRNIEQLDLVELAAVCDVVPEAARAAAEQGGCPAYADSDALFRDSVCDAVLIATPHYDHTSVGIAALESGHHVLVEKPISVHKADCERLIAAHRDERQVFGVMFNQRTDPHYRKIKQLVDEGELGDLLRVSWTITDSFRPQAYYDSGSWRATWAGEGGGVLLNQSPHQLDLFQWICGMPSKVWGFCGLGKWHDIEVEDEVTAYLEYPGGYTGTFITSTGEAPGTNRLEIAAEHGKLVFEDGQLVFKRTEMPVSELVRTSQEFFKKPATSDVTLSISGRGGQHKEILENFCAAILTGEPLIAPAAEGIHSVELANAMLYSSLTGGPVELPLDGAAFERELEKLIESSTFVKPGAAGA